MFHISKLDYQWGLDFQSVQEHMQSTCWQTQLRVAQLSGDTPHMWTCSAPISRCKFRVVHAQDEETDLIYPQRAYRRYGWARINQVGPSTLTWSCRKYQRPHSFDWSSDYTWTCNPVPPLQSAELRTETSHSEAGADIWSPARCTLRWEMPKRSGPTQAAEATWDKLRCGWAILKHPLQVVASRWKPTCVASSKCLPRPATRVAWQPGSWWYRCCWIWSRRRWWSAPWVVSPGNTSPAKSIAKYLSYPAHN